jgi:hemerythrin-like metal-binding protein
LVSESLNSLMDYVRFHCDREEDFLREHGYPRVHTHEEKHRGFRNRVAYRCVNASPWQAEISEDLLDFLANWWTDHILVHDMEYAVFLREKNLSSASTM